jgi:hypothetical protein
MDIDSASPEEPGGPGARLQVRFSLEQLAAVRRLAGGRSLSTTVRWLVQRALDAQTADQVPLAALVASEHVLQMLEVLLPGGHERSAGLRALAADAAERRLEEVGQEARL